MAAGESLLAIEAARPWRRVHDDCLHLRVRLTPKGGRDAVEGMVRLDDGACVLKARVRAAAEDGKANAALIELLAACLSLPASRLAVIQGMTARLKTVAIRGPAEEVGGRLAFLVGGAGQGAN